MKRIRIIVVLLVIATGCRSHPHQRQVLVTWNPSTTPNVTYNVYRSTTHGSGYKRVATGVKYSWYKEPMPEGTYFYVVTAVDSARRESGYSEELKVEVKH